MSVIDKVQVNNTTYDLKDTNLTNEVGTLKSALSVINGDSYTPVLTFTSGTIVSSDGSIVSPSGYKYSNMIPATEGESIAFSGVSGGTGMLVVAMYENASGNAVPSKSVAGSSYDTYSGTVVVPEGIHYIRLCAPAANSPSATITRYSLPEIQEDNKKAKDDITELQAFETEVNGGNYVPTLTFTNGLIYANDGSIVDSAVYKYCQIIPVSEGIEYNLVTANAGAGCLVLAMYASETDNANITYSIKGNEANPQEVEGKIPAGINFVRVCCPVGVSPTLTLSRYSLLEIENDIDSIKEEYGEKINHELSWLSGVIQFPSGNIVSPSAYSYSQEVAVKPGEYFELIASGSSGAMVLAAYDSNGNIVAKASSNGNNGTSITIKGVIPADVAKIRVCTSNTAYGSFQTWFPFERMITQATWEGFPYIYARRPVIGFMLDGEYDLNEAMHDVFAAHEKKCAFCITYDTDFAYNAITKYMRWQNEGFEIGAHGSKDISSNTSYTDDQVKGFIKAAYTTLVGYGFDVKGYVSLSGSTAERFIPEIKKWFSYGCTQPNHSGSDESCHMFGTAKPYYLWRYGMQISTLAEMKAAVDRAISENALLLFYGHAQSANDDNFTTENLDALLTYIEGKDIAVMRPYDAIASYFALRYEDFYPQN